jgi:hypothetical protein
VFCAKCAEEFLFALDRRSLYARRFHVLSLSNLLFSVKDLSFPRIRYLGDLVMVPAQYHRLLTSTAGCQKSKSTTSVIVAALSAVGLGQVQPHSAPDLLAEFRTK